MSRGAASWLVVLSVLAGCRPKAAPIRIDASVEPDDGSQGLAILITKKGLVVEDEPVSDVAALIATAKRHDAGRPPKAVLIAENAVPVRRVYEVKDALADIGIRRSHYMVLQKAIKGDAAAEDAGFAEPIAADAIAEVPFGPASTWPSRFASTRAARRCPEGSWSRA